MFLATIACTFLGLLINRVVGSDSMDTISGTIGMDRASSTIYCSDLKPQQSLDIGQIQGLWYGSEILQHQENVPNDDHNHHQTSEVISYNTCVVIHLAEVTESMRQITSTTRPSSDELGSYYNSDLTRARIQHYSYLKLIWDEADLSLEYTLRYNSSRRGFWLTSAPQEGSMAKQQYSQFTGTIQVMKAVGTHLVLTFCQSDGQLFSIILSRKANTLTNEEIQSVRSLLKRRGLHTTSVRKVCQNGAATMSAGFILILSIVHFFYVFS